MSTGEAVSPGAEPRNAFLPVLDAFRASLWLLAVKEISQALVAAHHAIELAMKALLESIHPTLVNDDVARGGARYECLKHVLAERFRERGFGHAIPDRAGLQDDQYENVHAAVVDCPADPDRTINFNEARRRVRELIPAEELSQLWCGLGRLHGERNAISHRGGELDGSLSETYLETLLEIAYPFFVDFFRVLGDTDSPLFAFLGCNHAGPQELLEVARNCFRRLTPEMDRLEATHTFRHAWWWGNHNYFGPTRFLTPCRDTNDPAFWSDVEQVRLRGRLFAEHRGDGILLQGSGHPNLSCRLCGADNYLVVVEPRVIMSEGRRSMRARAVHCVNCELDISDIAHLSNLGPVAAILAEEHVGPITSELLGEACWDQLTRDLPIDE